MPKLQGKSALVSGGASGIGRAIAQLFLEHGAAVTIADVNATLLEETLAELAPLGPVSGVTGDVRSMADAGRMVEAAVSRQGGLDILVCNAGITSVMPIEQLEEAEWDAVLATNVKGMFTLVKHAIAPMIARGGGKIVTLGSEMGFVAVPESPAYNASKGAVIMFTKSIRDRSHPAQHPGQRALPRHHPHAAAAVRDRQQPQPRRHCGRPGHLGADHADGRPARDRPGRAVPGQ